MTDSQLLARVAKAQRALWRFHDAVAEIESADHPDAIVVFEAICAEGVGGVVPDLCHVAHSLLERPERVKPYDYTGRRVSA